MFPDLRLLISATVVTFFLAATAGLYASLRITQDQITSRNDSRAAIEDTPIARIAATWPIPEPDRSAALRELMKVAKSPPVVASDETADAPERGDIDVPDISDLAAQPDRQTATEDEPAQHVTGSTGTAVQPEAGPYNQSGHPDIQGNIGETPEIASANPRAAKTARAAAKKAQQVSKKRTARIAQRRRQIAHAPTQPDRPLAPAPASGYPLYLTVPVTN